MAVDMYPDDEDVRRFADRIMEKRDFVLRGGGEQYQEYEQKDMSAFAPEDYQGSTKVGRAYTRSLLPYLPSKILNTFYKETHVQLDIRSSFSSFLHHAFSDCDVDVMGVYVEEPQRIYDHFRAELGISKSQAKKIINSIICSFPASAQDPELGNWAELSRDRVVSAITRDVGVWARKLQDRYPEFYEMVKTKCRAEGKLDHVGGVALSYLAADMEHAVMREVMKFLYPDQATLQNVVWKYDGLLFPMETIAGKTKERVVEDVKKHVWDTLLIDVDFTLSHLHENSLGICLGRPERGQDEGGDAYERWKGRFERRFARLDVPNVFMMFSRGGKSFHDLTSMEKFNHVTMEENKDFVKRWLEDPEKRKYKGRDFVPPPLVIEEGFLNLYHGIGAADLPPNEEEVDISPYLRHTDILVGNLNGEHPDYAEYLHKLVAQKIQRPGDKWRVMPIVRSAQGVGKDIWFDFLASIFGEEQCIKDDGVHKFAGTNSHCLEGKLLCCFQEMGFKETKMHEEALKAMITNKYIKMEKKYVNSFVVTNVVDFIGFTNQFGAINVSADDRRYFIVTADSTYAQDKDYILPLLAFFEKDKAKRAVYDYYMGLDLTGFDSSANRPTTEAHQELVEANVSHVDRFLLKSLPVWVEMCETGDRSGPPSRWDFLMQENHTLRIRAALVVDFWMEYAKEVGMDKADKKASMVQYFGRQVSELNGRTDKYKSPGLAKLIFKGKQGGNTKCYIIDYRGLRTYLNKVFNEDPEEEEEPSHPVRGTRSLHRNKPGESPTYLIRERGEVVFETDDIEEANKELGEAYVVTRVDEEGQYYQVLVHQRRNMEIPLGTEYLGQGGKQRLEAKYPFYMRDRTL